MYLRALKTCFILGLRKLQKCELSSLKKEQHKQFRNEIVENELKKGNKKTPPAAKTDPILPPAFGEFRPALFGGPAREKVRGV